MTQADLSAKPASAPEVLDARLPGARTALALLLAINLFNYIDRQVLAAVVPRIEEFLFPDRTGNPGFWMGLLSTAFLLSFMVFAPIFGWLADRMARWTLVAIGVGVWSMASAASGLDWPTGLAAAYWLLFATRCFVGIGEAAYGPAAPAIISDLFPVRKRGQVLAWFYLAIPVGGALGYCLGEVASQLLNWRWAFYLVMPPGVLLGFLCFRMPEPPRGQADPLEAPTRPVTLRDYRRLLETPSYVLDCLGMTAMTFAMGGLAAWMAAYLEYRQVAPIPLPGGAGVGPVTFFGGLTALAGLIATLTGGWLGDKLRDRFSGSYFLVSGAAMLGGFPMVLLVLRTPFPWAWVWVFLTVFCLFFNTGPTNTILANVSHPSLRPAAFGLNIFVIHALGDAISPPVMGWVRDHYGWEMSMGSVSVTMLLGGMLWLWGARYLKQDTERAVYQLDGGPPVG
jgi:MFS transporter, Spinster family, sphingosine-1-phosphate transporter